MDTLLKIKFLAQGYISINTEDAKFLFEMIEGLKLEIQRETDVIKKLKEHIIKLEAENKNLIKLEAENKNLIYNFEMAKLSLDEIKKELGQNLKL